MKKENNQAAVLNQASNVSPVQRFGLVLLSMCVVIILALTLIITPLLTTTSHTSNASFHTPRSAMIPAATPGGECNPGPQC